MISDPRPVEEVCSYEDYEIALRRFSHAVEGGDTVGARGFVEAPADLRYLRVVDDAPVEEREFDVEGLVAFLATVPGRPLRFDMVFVDSVADLAGDTPEREFGARPVDFAGLVRGTVACVDGRAALNQWLVVAVEDLEAGWPCDAMARGACYQY